MRIYCFLFIYLISFTLGALERLTCNDEIIRLDVGGKIFTVNISTLQQYSKSPIGVMFDSNKSFGQAKKSGQCNYFLDDDPEAFAWLLYFLRYKQVVTISSDIQAEKLVAIADKLCPPMLPMIKRKIFQYKAITLVGANKLGCDGEEGWYVTRSCDGNIIGCRSYGCDSSKLVDEYLNECDKRTLFKELCISWSGRGDKIYNIITGERIGEISVSHENDISKNIFNALSLHIKNSLFYRDELYLCTYNKDLSFSIYNGYTGNKAEEKVFKELGTCLFYMREKYQNVIIHK